jgi:hypothetical protein
MAQAVSRRTPIAEVLVQSRVGPCGICGGQSGTGTGFSPSTSFYPCQFHSTGAPLKWKSRKNIIIIIIIIIIYITVLHNKPSRLRCVSSICCGALKRTHPVRSTPLTPRPYAQRTSPATRHISVPSCLCKAAAYKEISVTLCLPF